ncbi:hypothetical protein OJ998_05615 [Solirubrobacter taibaiensis]|nr:hypothetical protein [Solirubrobacter taibaiensis]
MAPNRVVALAAPLIAPLAGAFAAWLSRSFPGLEVPEDAVEEVFLGVAALVFGLAFQFNHNRYKWDELLERQSVEAAPATDPLIDAAHDASADVDEFPVADEFEDEDLDFEADEDFEELLDDEEPEPATPAQV